MIVTHNLRTVAVPTPAAPGSTVPRGVVCVRWTHHRGSHCLATNPMTSLHCQACGRQRPDSASEQRRAHVAVGEKLMVGRIAVSKNLFIATCIDWERGLCRRKEMCMHAHGVEIRTLARESRQHPSYTVNLRKGDWLCPTCNRGQFQRSGICRCGQVRDASAEVSACPGRKPTRMRENWRVRR